MKPLKLTRPLCSLDIEATGLSLTRDRITSLTAVIITEDTLHRRWNRLARTWFVFPGIEIPAEIVEKTGITNEFVADKPPFEDVAAEILKTIEPCDFIGYNLRKFDIPFLHQHFARLRMHWNIRERNVIDVGELYQIKDPRTLEAAVEKFCGRKHLGAHDSENDAIETVEVFQGMREWYEDVGAIENVAELAKATQREEFIDLAGKIIKGKDGRPTYAFGERTKGVAVEDDWLNSDPGRSFAEWMLRQDFPADTCNVLRGILQDLEEKHRNNQQESFL